MEQPPLCRKPPREQGQGPSSFFYNALQWQNSGSGGKTTDLVNYGKVIQTHNVLNFGMWISFKKIGKKSKQHTRKFYYLN